MAGYSAKGAYIAKAQACLLAAILLLAAGAGPAFGCGACGCTLNSDWASQGFATIPGFSLGLRQDTFNQDQLRSGTSAPSRSTFGFPNGQEVQRQTLNRNTTLALDYVAAKAWGLTLTVPACNRFHSTTAPGDTEPSWSQGTGLGDLRVMARYLGFLEDASLGIQLGLKLATGAMNQTFQGGPQAGTPLDRGVQLGTGTTDLLLGVTRSGAWSPEWKYSGQALLQHPLASREDFRPGDGRMYDRLINCDLFNGTTLVHGHNGYNDSPHSDSFYSESGFGVININSRSNDVRISPYAIII